MPLFSLLLLACAPAGAPGGADTAPDAALDTAVVIAVEPAARVSILSPLDGAIVDNPVTFSVTGEGVAFLHLAADGWSLGEPWAPQDGSDYTYTFRGTGFPREIRLTGLDDARDVLVSDTITITVRDIDGVGSDGIGR